MRKILLLLVIVVALIGGGLYLAATYLPPTNPLNEAISGVQANVVDAVLNASGAKTSLQNTLESNVGSIASLLGVSVNEASTIVQNLDVESWTACSLPGGAYATDVIDGTAFGIDGSITLYNDPSYVSLTMFGQSIAFEIPESAQQYTPYLAGLQ